MLGFLVENGNDQNFLHNINAFASKNRCHVFSGSLIPTINTNTLQRYEAFHFNGTIITSSFRLCQQLAHLGYCKKRYYYIQNYEWMNADILPYRIMKNTLLHPNIDLIINDISLLKTVEDLSGKTVKYVMNNWDANILRQIADE